MGDDPLNRHQAATRLGLPSARTHEAGTSEAVNSGSCAAEGCDLDERTAARSAHARDTKQSAARPPSRHQHRRHGAAVVGRAAGEIEREPELPVRLRLTGCLELAADRRPETLAGPGRIPVVVLAK
jgi:hypothetical protein